MALEALEKEIDGVRYTSTKIPAMRATKLQGRLVRALGPSAVRIAGSLVAAIGAEGGGLEQFELERVNFGEIGGALSEAFSNLDDSATETLIREILSETSYFDDKGVPRKLFAGPGTGEFDRHFTGELPRMWKVVGFALGVNFGGFFDVVRMLVERGRPMIAKKAAVSASTAEQPT